MSKQKRKDLQGIRGLAIAAVVLFHFIPSVFKNGYAGVDQFFILSGYLMARILSKETKCWCSVILSFYYRRMKRLLPLYALCILLILVAALTIFPRKTFKYNTTYAIKSLMFISNFHEEDASLTYERMIADAKVLFTHTWSLSVEIQFYALAPFIILASLWMSAGVYAFFLCALYSISYFFFNYLFFWEEAESLAFNSVFTRIWQFTLGIMCSYYTRPSSTFLHQDKQRLLEDNADSENKVTEGNSEMAPFLSNLVLLSIILLIMFPAEVSSGLVRILICLQTAGLIIAGTKVPNWFLSHRILVYLGDISYSLYLVHWPIYVYFTQKEKEVQCGLFLGVLFSLIMAVLLTEFYEKFYLGLEKKSIVALCIFLYVANFAIILVNSPINLQKYKPDSFNQKFQVPANITKEMAIQMNKDFTEQDTAKLTLAECNYTNVISAEGKPWNLCTVNNTDFTGEKTILLIGNSYATNLARMMVRNEKCTEKAKNLLLYAKPSCEVLEDTASIGSGWCKDLNPVFLNVVKQQNPHFLFILTRHLTSMKRPPTGAIDLLLEEEKRRLHEIQQFVQQKIFLLTAFPRPVTKLTETVNSNLEKGIMVSEGSLIDSTANFSLARNRTASLLSSCSKCEIIDIMSTFMDKLQFQTYDIKNGLLYFTNGLHLTDYGLDKVRPIFSKICEQM